jgi:hypothetical protein
MKADKIIIDIFSTRYQSGMTKEDYQKFYEKNDTVYIILRSEGIYTKCKREKMFDLYLHHGCFIEHDSQLTPEDVRKVALGYVERENLNYVEAEEFKRIEEINRKERVAKAFSIAEKMIASN